MRIFKTTCKWCSEEIYYFPQKLVLETNKDIVIGSDTRIISLTCSSGCKKTINYQFPEQFIEELRHEL